MAFNNMASPWGPQPGDPSLGKKTTSPGMDPGRTGVVPGQLPIVPPMSAPAPGGARQLPGGIQPIGTGNIGIGSFEQNQINRPAGWQDLRAQVYGPTKGDAFSTGLTNTAASQYGSFNLPNWYGVGTADYGQANSTLGRALDATGGMNIRDFASMGPADYSKAQGLLGQSQGEIGKMRMDNYGRIDPNQFKESYGLLGQAKGAIPGQNAVRDFKGIGAGTYNPAGDTTQQRAMAMADLQKMHGAPDRSALAAQAFDLIQQKGQPGYEKDLRNVGAMASAFGRTNSGMTTNELTDVFSQRERDLDILRKQMSNDAAGQTLSDRAAMLQATQGLYGQNTNVDLANAGFQQGLRNEQRGERDDSLSYDFGKANLGINRAGALGSLAQGYAGLDTQKRNENVGERDFQAQQGLNQAQLAGQRQQAYAGLGGQQADISSNVWGQKFADRGFQADLASQRAQLAGQRAGIFSSVGGQQADIATNQYGQRAGERDSQLGYGLDSMNALGNRVGQLGSLEGQRFNQNYMNSQEQRGERDYQANQAQQQWQNNYNQTVLQDQLQNSAQDRWNQQATTMGNYGSGGAPWDTMNYGANQYQQSAQNQGQGNGQMLGQYAYGQAGQGYGGMGPNSPWGGYPTNSTGQGGYPGTSIPGQSPNYNQPPGAYNYSPGYDQNAGWRMNR